MTKDFKGGHSSASKTSQYGVSWMLGGIAIGLLVGIAIYAFAHMSPNDANASANTNPATTTQTTAAASATSPVNVNTATADNTAGNGNASLRDTPSNSNDTGSNERPGFSYHALLPEVDFTPEVPVMHEPTPTVNKKKADDKPAQEQETEQDITRAGRYMFQVGAFKTAQQAENRRRKLQSIGLNTRVEKAEVRGQLWHRVRLGPSTDLKMVNRWQQTLQRAGLDYTKIRL